jgi:hypothetical protein
MSSEVISLNMSTVSVIANEFSLVTLLQSKLANAEFVIKTKINEDGLRVLNLVLSKCPISINSMGMHIKKIVSDQVINSKDIPEIILLVQEVLNTNVKELNKLKVTREEVITLVKNIFVILIESNEIKTTPENKQTCLDLVDLSIKLLESKVNVQKVIRCKFFTPLKI